MLTGKMHLFRDGGAAGGGAPQAGAPAPTAAPPAAGAAAITPEAFAQMQQTVDTLKAELAEAKKPKPFRLDREKLADHIAKYRETPELWEATREAMGEADGNAQLEQIQAELAELKQYKTTTELNQLKQQMLRAADLPESAMPLLTAPDAEGLKTQIEALKTTLPAGSQGREQQSRGGVQYPALGGDNKPAKSMTVKQAWDHATS